MRLSCANCIRRILNSPHDAFRVIPKPAIWLKREQTWRFTAWCYGQQRDTSRTSQRFQNKIFHYLNMHRLDQDKLERFYSERRVMIALKEHDFEYKHFRNMLSKAHILLDNIVLSQLAMYEPRTFKSLVMLTKEMASQEEGRIVLQSPEQARVQLDTRLFGRPFIRNRDYPRGPAENHTNKPRQLREDEY